MHACMTCFESDETGAITIDWTVLTAAMVVLGLAAVVSVGAATIEFADSIVSGVGASTGNQGDLSGSVAIDGKTKR